MIHALSLALPPLSEPLAGDEHGTYEEEEEEVRSGS